MWLYNAASLSKHFQLFAVDTMGGPSKSRPDSRYNKDFDDITWIDEVLDGLGLGAVYMAGSVPAGTGSPFKTMIKIFLPEDLFPTRKNTEKLLAKLAANAEVFTSDSLIAEKMHL